MNKKHFIGENAKRFESLGPTDPIGGVILKVDAETAYMAGDQTGYVLEAECPYGTQAMAEALLAAVRGKSYRGFEAEGARLPADAELGDGVTVKGMYGPLVRRRVRFGGELGADISAPAGGDTDHEFGYTDPVLRQIELAEARSRSYIDRRTDEIRVGVEDLDNAVRAELDLKVGKNDNGQVVSMLNAAADQIDIRGDRFVLESSNFTVSKEGKIWAQDADIEGKVKANEFELQNTNISIDEQDLKTYSGYDVPPVDPGMSVDPPPEYYEVFHIASSAGMYTERIYSGRAQLGYLGCGEGSFSQLVATKLGALEIREQGESLQDRYLRRNEGVWKQIKDGDGNLVSVLCWNI